MRSWTGWIVGLAGMWALAGCGGERAQDGAAPEVFVFARGADAQKLDPADVDDGESVNTLAQMLEGLLAFKPGTTEVEPRLAESYAISEDGLTYTFQIREGVRFHDGTPLTAETAAWSFRRQMDPAHPAHLPEASFQYWKLLFDDVEAIEVTGPMELTFRLARPNAALQYAFATFPGWLVSPGAFERYGTRMQQHPVGTGPYRFVRWEPGQAVMMERNEDYWREPGAGFARLVLRSIPLNATRLAELEAGDVHGLDGLQPAELADLRADPRFTVHHAPGSNVGYLAFSAFSEPLQDPGVRRAIALAIDREALVELAFDGYGAVADFPVPPGFLGREDAHDPDLDYDPEAARALLAEHPEVLATTLTLAAFNEPRSYFPDPARIASLIRSDLEAVGLEVEIVTREFKTHLHLTRRGEFDLAILGWMSDTPDTSNFLDTFFHSRSAEVGAATNISFYRSDAMDTLLDAALATTDAERRGALYGEALDLWAQDLPLVPLVHGEQIVVLRRELGGYVLDRGGNHFFGPLRWEADHDQ
ncbi:MAG: ABC transporter substrate-binding protein [Verrucomicrobiota bacterium]